MGQKWEEGRDIDNGKGTLMYAIHCMIEIQSITQLCNYDA